ncbi:hypothetical protein LCGC14_2941950 [marine sediment metagenome]|uniref:Uncharacterized protein n=1 Tax=marine sediment metagenome TaxID=412755 RepID=A0A0F8XIA8_9ZZZZ
MTKKNCKKCGLKIKKDRVYCDTCYLEKKLKGKENDPYHNMGGMF